MFYHELQFEIWFLLFGRIRGSLLYYIQGAVDRGSGRTTSTTPQKKPQHPFGYWGFFGE